MPRIDEIFNKDSVMIVLSSHEMDTAADTRLKTFVKDFVKLISRFSSALVVEDTVAAKYDLARYNLFVIGTPGGNAMIEKVLPGLPLRVNGDGITGEKKYEGKGFVLLAGWVNPYNSKKVMTVMTALNPDDLVNFNSAPFGGSNYHIMKNFITYKVGDYKRSGQVWMCE
jgi:hypothetical protein